MPKNIVVFSDGTGQDGGVRPEQRVSNIYKLYRTARVSFDNSADPTAQVTLYDPGLGTDVGATALTSAGKFIQKLLSSVDGRGITTNIADCYEFIINQYEAGDRIFLFGFSRGAYTVRCVADILRLCGVPTKTPNGPLIRHRDSIRKIAEEATNSVLEHGAGHPRGGELEAEREELARRFREKYGSDHPGGEARRSNVAPYFIGVFDTVAALGATGLRRAVIQTVLYALTSVVAAALGLLVAIPVGLGAHYVAGVSFWPALGCVEAIIVFGSLARLLFSQRRSFKKTIYDFPKKGDKRSHCAEWEGKNFNRLLSRFVTYARSANAIDETRADFDRVPWGPTMHGPSETAGHDTFKQFFFAGNHSDIGGSYAEVESRLSDIALAWMIEEAIGIPDGLKVGPVWVNGVKMPGTGNDGQPLYLHPADDALQHCEIAATRDRLSNLKPKPLAWFFRNQNYATKIRSVPKDAVIHPGVRRRFELPGVPQPEGFAPYRPAALREVSEFKSYYEPIARAENEAPTPSS